MYNIKKNRYKPFYNQFIKLKDNVQKRRKLLNFKKSKWNRIQFFIKKKLKFFKRFKLQDPFTFKSSKFAHKGNTLSRRFKHKFYEQKKFQLFYGGFKKKYLKNVFIKIKTLRNKNFLNKQRVFLKFFESRLDTILYFSKFCFSIKNARQLIKHGHVLVNGVKIKSPYYLIKTDDLIEIEKTKKARLIIKHNFYYVDFWPIPPKYLLINYKTLQILFLWDKNKTYLTNINYPYNINNVLFSKSSLVAQRKSEWLLTTRSLVRI